MSPYKSVYDPNLRIDFDISKELSERHRKKEFCLRWRWDLGYVEPERCTIPWSEQTIKDMVRLQNLGVRGYIILNDEAHLFSKYDLTDRGVEERHTYLSFPKDPDETYKTPDDVGFRIKVRGVDTDNDNNDGKCP